MSTNIEHIKATNEKINKISPTFCMAKWRQVTFYLHQGATHSCYHCQVHRIDLAEVHKDIRAFHNTAHKRQMRNLMLDGEKPTECDYCWQIEKDPESFSDRHYRNAENWAEPYIEETAQEGKDAMPYPHYVELSFTHHCNFKCSYCVPGASSRWEQEIRQHGDYPIDNRQYSIDGLRVYREDENPYIEAFWRWFPEAYNHMHVLRFTGGEPLLSKNVYKIIDYVQDNPNPKLEFSINSNLGVPERSVAAACESINRMLDNKSIGKFRMFTSIDTWGTAAEWARNGLSLDTWKNNVETYLKSVPEGNLSFMITYHLNSFARFRELLEYILYLRKTYTTDQREITIDVPYLLEPDHLTAFLAPDSFMSYLDADLRWMEQHRDETARAGFTSVDLNGVRRLATWIRHKMKTEDPDVRTKNRAQFYLFAREHDRRRGTSYTESMPEMERFYNTCKRIAGELKLLPDSDDD